MKAFILLIFTIVSIVGYGGIEHFSSRISGTQIVPNASFKVTDDKYYDMLENPSNWNLQFVNYRVSNKVVVGLNPGVRLQTPFDGEVKIKVTYEVWNPGTLSFDQLSISRTLEVAYDADGYQQQTDRSTLVLSGAHRMTVSVTELTNVEAEDLFIEGHIEVERYYSQVTTQVEHLIATPYPVSSSPLLFSDPANEFIDLSWDFYPGAESYELEYVHINDYTLQNGEYRPITELSFNYYRNSTRVELLTNYYRIPNIYDHGYFIFRVRPIMRKTPDYTQKLSYNASWSEVEAGLLSDHNPEQVIFIGREYDQKMNWAHQVAFTEEGKRFESVSFGDGLGRGRQTVARNTATNQTVVSNVYFDELGRAVITDLPTPLDLLYPVHHPDFNRAEVGGLPSFNATNFDDPSTSDGVCTFNPYGMSSLHGASRYYSYENDNQEGANGTIPDAGNFPYSRIHYLTDFTGRVDITAAAGSELTIGGGHETRYHYVTATQPELYQLFGEEVGDASHYQKLVTVDPNGQVYVQFTDMAGRVIASYMMGPSPTNLEELEETVSEEMTFPLIVNGSGQIPDYTEVIATHTSTHYFAEDNENYTVDYLFTPQQYQSMCSVAPVCFDCVYELEMKIQEKCGTILDAFSTTITGEELDRFCGAVEDYPRTFDRDFPRGEYTFTKTLRVNQQVINEYWCMYIDNIKDECLTPVSELFNERYGEETFPKCDDEEYLTEFDQEPGCNLTKLLMAGDITPGGQYAIYTANAGVYSSTDPVSIFYGSTPAYTTFNFGTITVMDPVTNTLVSPSALSLKNYILLFDPAWATYLIENEPDAHPESCMLGFCDISAASAIYEQGMKDTYTFEEAIAYNATTQIGGYFLPINFATPPSGSVLSFYFGANFADCDVHLDPFFATGGPGAAYASAMEDRMDNYIDLGSAGAPCMRSIWEYSVLSAYLQANPYVDITGMTCGEIGIIIRDLKDECLKDLIWTTYRKYYLELKQNYVYAAQAAYAAANCPSMPEVGTGTGPYAGSWPHFPGIEFVNQVLNGVTASNGGGSIDFSDMSNGGAIQDVVDNFTEQGCTTACEDYADEWIQKLSGCGFNPADLPSLKTAFKNLCMSGCDTEHPYGASTNPTNPNNTIKNILTAHGYSESMLCNEWLIDQPAPHGNASALIQNAVIPLDKCVCDKVLQAYYDLPTSGFTYPEQVLEAQTGVPLEEIDFIACECNEIVNKENEGPWTPGYEWPAFTNTILAMTEIEVFPSLGCPESQGCVDCDAVTPHVAALLSHFGFDTHATLKGDYDEFLTFPTSYLMLTNYLNAKLKFQLDYDDYANFIGSCLATETDPYCTVNPHFTELSSVLKLISFRGQLTSATTVDLVQQNIVYANSQLYEQNILGRYFSGSVSGNVLTMSFTNGSTPCEVALTLPSEATFGFEDIVSFGQFLPLTTSCTSNNTFRVQVNYFSCGIMQTGFIEGTTDCLNVNLCACGDAGQTLCNDLENESTALCYQPALDELYTAALDAYQQQFSALYDQFKAEYNAKCAQAFQTENYSYTGPMRMYQYTLFYYDQAGNLIKTIAPMGADKVIGQDDAIRAAQEAVAGPGDNSIAAILPDHKHVTSYIYNSYDQLVTTTNPDQDGETRFWYDRYGRIVASQNPIQKDRSSYSYTFYDEAGRPYEVGQTKTVIALSEAIVKTDDLGTAFRNWVNGGQQAEITKTYYDVSPGAWVPDLFSNGMQQNLRLRVASVLYYDVEGALMTYVSATHYSYDIHGNVKEQVQDVPALKPVQQDAKSTQYTYELISGNVQKVDYQKGKPDAITQQYHYDELNRLTEAESTIDNGVHSDRHVHYRYYDYGPLARVEYGRNQVQGQDYAYTINGWIKGMNASVLSRSRDMGKDGTTGYFSHNQGVHNLFARDVTAYTLSYYQYDYKPIGGAEFEVAYGSSSLNSDAYNLYNGNIRSVFTSIMDMKTMGKSFLYDQLQRLKKMGSYFYEDNGSSYSWNGITGTAEYANSYSYDKNGNLRTLQRNGNDIGNSTLEMDNFEYMYEDPVNNGYNNRLSWVKDHAGASIYGDIDIDHSMYVNGSRYEYDELGQLISDEDEGIQNMEWRQGDKKLKRITRSDAESPELEFVYNPFGQRVLKIEKMRSGGSVRPSEEWKYTYYSYDANGQVMAVYDVVMSPEDNRAYAAEHHLYGASRVGMIQQDKILFDNGRYPSTDIPVSFQHIEGQTYYEMVNYLGNVEAVITDRKMWMELATEEQSVQEVYYDQFTTAGNLLDWSFGDPAFTGNALGAGYSITATGGQLVMYAGSTTGSLGSAMKQHYFENGVEYTLSFDIVTSTPTYVVAGDAGTNILTQLVTSSGSYIHTFTGNGQTLWYGFACPANQTIRLDNIRLTKVVNHGYEAVVVRTADYYPYGMVMPGRNKEYVAGKYRFGYNGMEMDNEVSGNGNSYTTEFRQYDPRLGRWKSLDPLMGMFPSMSPYCAFDNNPIYYTDIYGLSSEGGGDPPVKMPGDRSFNDKKADENEMIQLPNNPAEGQVVSFVYTNGEKTTTSTWTYASNKEGGRWEKGVTKTTGGAFGEGQYVSVEEVNNVKLIAKVDPPSTDLNNEGIDAPEGKKTQNQAGTDVEKVDTGLKDKSVVDKKLIDDGKTSSTKAEPKPININTTLKADFGPGNSTLTNPSHVRTQLTPLADILIKNPNTFIILRANTLVGGDDGWDTKTKSGIPASELATNRNYRIRRMLIEMGVSPDQILPGQLGSPKAGMNIGVRVMGTLNP